jgi:HEAT repeat protein
MGEDAVPALLEGLRSECAGVRAGAARTLGGIRVRAAAAKKPFGIPDRRASQALIETLKDGDSAVRRACIEALGRMRDKAAVEPLVQYLTDGPQDESWRAPEAIAEALRRIGDDTAIELLISLMVANRDPAVRARCARALGSMKDRRAVESLIAALEDSAPAVRKESAWALGYVGDKSVIEPWTTALVSCF